MASVMVRSRGEPAFAGEVAETTAYQQSLK